MGCLTGHYTENRSTFDPLLLIERGEVLPRCDDSLRCILRAVSRGKKGL